MDKKGKSLSSKNEVVIMNQEKLGKYLVTLRKERGLTQREVAKQIGVTEQAVSKWERGIGTPDIGLWNNICETFKIEPIELFQGGELQKKKDLKASEINETKKIEEYNDILKQTIEISNTEINRIKFKQSILLTILSISIYITSLITQNYILNISLFVIASSIIIYLMGYFLKKQKYIIKFIICIFVLLLIFLSYSFLEKISIINQFRQPIFSIIEIYKEDNITIYNSFFYKAYSCNSVKKEITLLDGREIKKICANKNDYDSIDSIQLKSGAIITNDQKLVLELFQAELLKKGFVDYDYMRQKDLNNFWKYLDNSVYCGTYDNENSNLVVKRKDGVCQYSNDDYYYCSIQKKDGTLEYKKAKNKQCNGK